MKETEEKEINKTIMNAKIKATGEIKELSLAVFSGTQVVSYRDSNVVYYNTHEVETIPDQPAVPIIDWEQRRYDIAKAAMQAFIMHRGGSANAYLDAENSVFLADTLINHLKNNPVK